MSQALVVDWAAMPTEVLFRLCLCDHLRHLLGLFPQRIRHEDTVSPSVVSAYIYLQPVLGWCAEHRAGQRKTPLDTNTGCSTHIRWSLPR